MASLNINISFCVIFENNCDITWLFGVVCQGYYSIPITSVANFFVKVDRN